MLSPAVASRSPAGVSEGRRARSVGYARVHNEPSAHRRRAGASARVQRHAIRPHAAKETPESVWITAYLGSGGPRAEDTGISAAKLAAPAAAHSASQNHALCVGSVNRLSPWTRPRATGRATSSPAPAAQGIKRIIRRSRPQSSAGSRPGDPLRSLRYISHEASYCSRSPLHRAGVPTVTRVFRTLARLGHVLMRVPLEQLAEAPAVAFGTSTTRRRSRSQTTVAGARPRR